MDSHNGFKDRVPPSDDERLRQASKRLRQATERLGEGGKDNQKPASLVKVVVYDLMTDHAPTLRAEMTVYEAAEQMREEQTGPLPVCDVSQRLIGIVGKNDLMNWEATMAQQSLAHSSSVARVRDLMSAPDLYVFDDQDAEEAVRVMASGEVNSLITPDNAGPRAACGRHGVASRAQ